MPWGSLAGYRSPSLRQETTEERKRESGTGEMNDIFLMENVCHRKKNEDVRGRGKGTGRGTKEEQTGNIPRLEKPQNLIPPLGGMKMEVTGVFSNVCNSLLRLLHTSK